MPEKYNDMKPQIEVKFNTVRCWENCPLCGKSFKPDMMRPWPFLSGSWRPICETCAAEYDLHYPYPVRASARGASAAPKARPRADGGVRRDP